MAIAIVRMAIVGGLLVGTGLLGAATARTVAEEARFHGGLHLGSQIACGTVGVLIGGLIAGVSMHRRGLTVAAVAGLCPMLVWAWLNTALASLPDTLRIPPDRQVGSILLVVIPAIVSAPIWQVFGRFVGRVGPRLTRSAT